MFDVVIDVLFAWQQIGLLLMGFIFMAVGGGIVFYEIYCRKTSIRVKGRISAVRMIKGKGSVSEGKKKKKNFAGEMYHPVFEYKMPNGELVETIGSMASSGLLGKLPGKIVTLMISPNDNKIVRRPSVFLPIFGLIFFLPGIFIMNIALTSFDINYVSILMFFGLLGFIAYKIRKAILKIPDADRKKIWEKIKDRDFSDVKVTTPKKKEEKKGRILERHEIIERVKLHIKHARIAAYGMFVIAPCLAGGAYYTGSDMLERVSTGVQVVGEVVDIKSRYSSNSDGGSSYTYYSVVKFADLNGNSVRFEDSVGSSSPMHRRGDEVEVLYIPQDPEDAIIDRGIFNWGLSGGLAFGALLLGWGAMYNLRASRRRF